MSFVQIRSLPPTRDVTSRRSSLMRNFIPLCFCVLLMASPVMASDQGDVVMRIQQTIDAWQRGDIDGVAAIMAPEPALVDNVPPYLFKGPNALADYIKVNAADNQKDGITDQSIALETAREVKVDGPNAYVVVPAEYRFKRNNAQQSYK